MKKTIYIFMLFFLLINTLTACFEEKIIFYHDEQIKDYFNLPENKDLRNASKLSFDEFITEALNSVDISVLCSNENYAVGLAKELEWPRLSTRVCYYNSGEAQIIFDFSKMKPALNPGTTRNFHIYNNIYYNPYSDSYEDIINYKKISENKVIITYTCIKYNYPGSGWLFPLFMTEDFYNEVKIKADKKGLKEEFLTFSEMYKKTYKEKFMRVYNPDGHLSLPAYYKRLNIENINFDVFCNDFYFITHNEQNNDAYDKNTNINLFLQRLGYSEMDLRRENLKFGFDGSGVKSFIIEITIEMLPDAPEITFNVVSLSPEGEDFTWVFEQEGEN